MEIHFLVMEKSWKIIVEKELSPWMTQLQHAAELLMPNLHRLARRHKTVEFRRIVGGVNWTKLLLL